jgi:acyl carrier protein
MTNAEVEAALVAAVTDCLEASGKPVKGISAEVVPLADLEGFDSLCAIEVLVQLEAQSGLKAEIDVFFDGKGHGAKKRTIKEIAAAINH